jgi:hypothetical protein
MTKRHSYLISSDLSATGIIQTFFHKSKGNLVNGAPLLLGYVACRCKRLAEAKGVFIF